MANNPIPDAQIYGPVNLIILWAACYSAYALGYNYHDGKDRVKTYFRERKRRVQEYFRESFGYSAEGNRKGFKAAAIACVVNVVPTVSDLHSRYPEQ